MRCISCGSDSGQLVETLTTHRTFYFCSTCTLVFADGITSTREDFYGESDRSFVDQLAREFSLNNKSFVLHVGSGTGSFLKFVKAKSVPCLGVEVNHQYAQTAMEKHVNTLNAPFDVATAWDMLSESNVHTHGNKFDVIVLRRELHTASNIADALEAISLVLREDGVCILEIDWILDCISTGLPGLNKYEDRTIFSLHALRSALGQHDLEITDIHKVEQDRRLRITVRHMNLFSLSPFVTEYFGEEVQAGVLDREGLLSHIQ